MPSIESSNYKLDYTGSFPDQLKLIKTVTAFPFEITATGSLNPRSQQWNYTVGCRDVLLNGKLTFNASRGAVEYRKVLPLPILGGVTKPVLAAEWQIGRIDDWQNWRKPRLQIGFAIDDTPSNTDDGANLNTDGSISFRKKAFVSRRWGLEVDGSARFSFQHDMTGAGNLATAFGLGVTARELNIVCRI